MNLKQLKFNRLNKDEQKLIKQIECSQKIEIKELYVLIENNDWLLFYNKNTNEYVYNYMNIKYDYDKQLLYKEIIKTYLYLIYNKEISKITLNSQLKFNLTIMYNKYKCLWK